MNIMETKTQQDDRKHCFRVEDYIEGDNIMVVGVFFSIKSRSMNPVSLLLYLVYLDCLWEATCVESCKIAKFQCV